MAEPLTVSRTAARPSRRPRRRPDPAVLGIMLLVALTVVPLVSSAAHILPGWVPQGDDATIVLRGDDLFSSNTPLLGMPSTVGDAVDAQVHHPGPLESQAIGLVASVVEDPRVAVVVVTIVNLASVLAVLWWARQLGGRALLVGAAAVVTALLWSLRGPILVTPFNPYAAVLPFLACLASAVAATERRPWAVTATVLSASWAAQAHLTTTGPVVAAVSAAGAVAALRSVRRRRRTQPSEAAPGRRRLLVGTGAFVACWAFPVTEAVVNGGGNVRSMLQATGSLDDETLGAQRAVDVIVQAVAVPPAWARAGTGPLDLLAPPSTSRYLVAALVAVAAVIVAVVCRARRPAVTTAVVVASSSLAVGGLLMTKIPGSFFNLFALHNYLWLWPVSAVLWVAVLAGLGQLAGDRLVHGVPVAAVAVPAAVAVAVLALLSTSAPHRAPGTEIATYVRSVAPTVAGALDPEERYMLDLDPDIDTYGVGTGLLHHLERSGFDVRVPARFAPSFGDHRVAGDEQQRHVLVVRVGPEEHPPPDPEAVAVAAHRPPPDLVAQREEAVRGLTEEIRRRGGVSVGPFVRIEPADAEAWVRSGGFVNALQARLVDERLRASPPARTLESLADAPVDHVVVYRIPGR